MQNIKIIHTSYPTTPSPDPTTHRHIQVSTPASHHIPDDILLHQIHNFYDPNIIKQHFKNEGQLTHHQLTQICTHSTKLLSKEPNLLQLHKRSIIIGDIHGQFYDLLHLLEDFNLKNDTLVFLGDYVDRGYFSAETYVYLLSLKIQYPRNIYLLRGNHESEKMTSYFTFKQECAHKYGLGMYRKLLRTFMNLPLAAIVNDAFCCHGGLSPAMTMAEEINSIDRVREVPYSGLFCDLLWADPNPKFESRKEYSRNTQRNCSYFYSAKAVDTFCSNNKVNTIIRGHEVQQTGYSSITTGKNKVITIFSAPNYCDVYGNTGAYIVSDPKINQKSKSNTYYTIVKYDSVYHPFYLPTFCDVINWSFPFVSEKIAEFYKDLLDTVSIDNHILCTFIHSMVLMRNDRECINEIDEESTEVPCCSLKNVDYELGYEDAKSSDSENEKIKSKSDVSDGRSLSCTNELVKKLEDVEIKGGIEDVIESSSVDVDKEKKVLEVKINKDKKYKKGRK